MGKHWDIVKEAYRHEKEQLAKKVAVEQKDFLPAALEILEKPASPVGRFTIWTICAFFLIALLWATFGRIDIVASAPGKVVLIGQTKTVQSFEAGVIRQILVSNGVRVEKGDSLIELDATRNTADIARLTQELQAASLIVERNNWLLASIEGDEAVAFNVQYPLTESQILLQTRLANSQLNEYRATQDAFNEQVQERHAELHVTKSQLAKIKQTLPLLEEQVAGFKKLSEDGVSPRFQYLEYEENLIARRKDLGIERERILQIDAAIRSLKKQKEQHQQEYLAKLIRELAEAEDTKIAVDQELIKAQQTNALHVIKAPVTGIVQQLAIHTVGGVVRSGDPLMAIVPEERKLQVEATILNKDIGFVSVGQDAEIKLEAFPFTKYGVLHGKLLSIDHDAVQDEQLGLIYPARIEIFKNAIAVDGKAVTISPGMGLIAEMKTGKRRVIEFLLAPLFRYQDESLRER